MTPTTTTTPTPDDDPEQEIQDAIDRLAVLVFERWGEGVPVERDDLRDALAEVRPLVRELDALWTYLRDPAAAIAAALSTMPHDERKKP